MHLAPGASQDVKAHPETALQRQAATRARVEHSRDSHEALPTVANDLGNGGRCLKVAPTYRHGRAEHVVSGETGVDILQVQESPDEQGGSDDENHGNSYLAY